MIRPVLIAWLVVAAATLLPAAGTAQTIQFQRMPGLPDGVTVSVLSDASDVTAMQIEPTETGWTYSFVLHPIRWREEPTFLISVPARTIANGGVDSAAMVLELDFSFKATERDRVIEVPLAAFAQFGNAERQRIEALPVFAQFEQIMLSQGLTRHFEARLSGNDGSTRRMAQVWFDSLVRAIQPADPDRRRPLRLGTTVVDTVARVFDGNGAKLSYFRGTVAQIRAAFWRDLLDAPKLLEVGQCDLLRLLAEDLRRRHGANPDDARLMQIGAPLDVLDKLDADVASCG